MKFEEKYELLESLTTGKVETFVANDKLRGERVVVHILHCDPQKPNQPTVQWVLDSFRRVAPEPAGLVLETGRYGGTLYAYLVTKMPDKAVLRSWVQQYTAQAKDTQEIPVPTAESEAETETATAEVMRAEPKPAEPKPVDPARVPVQFTQVFREFESHPTPSGPSIPAKEPKPVSLPLPNLGAEENPSGLRAAPDWNAATPAAPVPQKREPKFSSPAPAMPNLGAEEDPSGLRAAPAWDEGIPLAPPPRQESKFNIPAPPTRPDFPVQSFPVETPKTPAADRPKPGEFTSFFRGPFHVEGPAEISPVSAPPSPREIEPPRKSVGSFTDVFGPIATPAGQPPPSSGTGGSQRSSSGFTSVFGDSEILSQKPAPAAPPPPVGLPRAISDAPASPSAPPKEPKIAAPPIAPAAPVFSTLPPPIPVPPKPPAVTPIASAPDGATGAFSTPSAGAPIPSEPGVPSGPSPYTQIISVRPPNLSGSPGSTKQTTAKAPGMSAFPPPVMPPPPAIARPPMPPAPAIPKRAAPPPPAAPKLPKAESPKHPVSYWPLVLVLTVLLFIAVLLVLYFVLKH